MDSSNKYIQLLEKLKQTPLLTKLKENPDKLPFVTSQLEKLEQSYPGGLEEYVNRAKVLLQNSKLGKNPYSDFTPSVPSGVNIDITSKEFEELEEIGLKQIANTGFVLVAGGLGERLGYPGIKVGIPVMLIQMETFLNYYIEFLKAYEIRGKNIILERKKKDNPNITIDQIQLNIPLVIMTSDDTHEQTKKLLDENDNFGLKSVKLVKQEKVPALLNNDCLLSFNKETLEIETKPHGHGDVHTLLLSSGIVDEWNNRPSDEKIKYVVFFQDTNALSFRGIPSLLGVSERDGYKVNTLTVPRKPGDSMGAICKLTSKDREVTLNVEYNQIDQLLRDKFNKDGDVADEKTGNSFFPANTNTLAIEFDGYYSILKQTKGLMPEFVNPKYADSEKNTFKSATRIECMMQDYPLLLNKEDKVGFTSYPFWFCFNCSKNNLSEAIARIDKNLSAESAFSVEQNMFNFYVKLLELFNKIEIVNSLKEGEPLIHGDIVRILNKKDIDIGPKIYFAPSFAVTVKELISKIKVDKIKITKRSTLIVDSQIAVYDKDFIIDGTLIIRGEIVNYKENSFIKYVALKEDEGELYEKVRGFKIEKSN